MKAFCISFAYCTSNKIIHFFKSSNFEIDFPNLLYLLFKYFIVLLRSLLPNISYSLRFIQIHCESWLDFILSFSLAYESLIHYLSGDMVRHCQLQVSFEVAVGTFPPLLSQGTVLLAIFAWAAKETVYLVSMDLWRVLTELVKNKMIAKLAITGIKYKWR